MATKGRPPKKPVAQRIEDALGVAQTEIAAVAPEKVESVDLMLPPTEIVVIDPKLTVDAKDDSVFVRSNLHALLLKGNEILDGIIELAQESDQPRAFEVAGVVLKTLIDGSRELMALHKDIHELAKKAAQDTPANPNVNIDSAENVNVQHNVVLHSTTMDVLEIIRKANEEKRIKEGN